MLTDKVRALEDQILACLTCWKALFAAATLCVISVSKVQSEAKMLSCVVTTALQQGFACQMMLCFCLPNNHIALKSPLAGC